MMTDTPGPLTPIVLRFPAPTHPLSVNERANDHWAARRKRLEPWTAVAWAVARQRLGHLRTAPPAPITVRVDIPFTRRARRDPHNYTSTVVKAVVDGLVKAGLVPDDTPEWVTVLDPTILIYPASAGRAPEATVTIWRTQQ